MGRDSLNERAARVMLPISAMRTNVVICWNMGAPHSSVVLDVAGEMTPSDCDRASRDWFTSNNVSAASSHVAPTKPRWRGLTWRSEKLPSAAPTEKPRYMNDAFKESATGAAGTPTISMSRVCCAGKNAHEDIPHRAIAASTGT